MKPIEFAGGVYIVEERDPVHFLKDDDPEWFYAPQSPIVWRVTPEGVRVEVCDHVVRQAVLSEIAEPAPEPAPPEIREKQLDRLLVLIDVLEQGVADGWSDKDESDRYRPRKSRQEIADIIDATHPGPFENVSTSEALRSIPSVDAIVVWVGK